MFVGKIFTDNRLDETADALNLQLYPHQRHIIPTTESEIKTREQYTRQRTVHLYIEYLYIEHLYIEYLYIEVLRMHPFFSNTAMTTWTLRMSAVG